MKDKKEEKQKYILVERHRKERLKRKKERKKERERK